MKIIIIIFLTVLTSINAQTSNFKILLDSAKNMFNNNRGIGREEFDKIDYNKIVLILNEAINLKPNNAEAHYFLGYTYSRINSRDGRSLTNANLDLVNKSSEQIEIVNKLTPKYTGEMIVLDPYSKLTSEWGALAMSYWYNNKSDSAIWAFNEGKKRGGFGEFVLAVNRKSLDICSKNSILISSGDNFTIPLWYLQIVEGYRTDIKVIDISLLNTIWYPAYLRQNNIVSFNLSNEAVDTIEYIQWEESKVTINNFSWIIQPSYGQYLLRGDRLFLSLLEQNKFRKDIFFTMMFSEESRLSLKNNLEHLNIVDKLITTKTRNQSFKHYREQIISLLLLSNYLNKNSMDEIDFFDNFRYNLFSKINDYLIKKNKKKAKILLEILNNYGNENNIPYNNENNKKFVDYLRAELK